MALDLLNVGDSRAATKAKMDAAFAEVGLPASSNTTEATDTFNELVADWLVDPLPGLADGMAGSTARSRINAAITALNGGGGVVPSFASLYFDWENNRYFGGVPVLSRASKAWDFNAADVLYEADNNVLRRVSGRGALLEAPRTNSTVSTDMLTGVALGVIGSGGSMPNNWSAPGSGWTGTITDFGIDPADGLPFLRLRLQRGATANTYFLNYGPSTNSPCVQGERYLGSAWIRMVDGSTTGLNEISLSLSNRNAAQGGLPGSAGINMIASPSVSDRRLVSFTATAADTAYMLMYTTIAANGSAPVDITLEIKMPQQEKVPVGSDYHSSPIITGGSVVTRSGDILSAAAADGGRAFVFKYTALDRATAAGFKHLLEWSDGTSTQRHAIYVNPTGGLIASSRSGSESTIGGSSPVPFNETGVIYGVVASNYRRASRIGAAEGTISTAGTSPVGINMLGIGGTGYNTSNNTNIRARLFAEAPVSAFTVPADAYAWAKAIAEGWA